MTLHLNPTMAVRLDPVYEYGPEQTNSEGETYREVIGVKPGCHIEVNLHTIALHPALAWGGIVPRYPVHDPGELIRTRAESLEVYRAAAPPSVPPSPYDLFYEGSEV